MVMRLNVYLRIVSSVICSSVVLFSSVFFHVAHAVPAFARQMNAECSQCHAQHFAKLNAFGRAFKASGYSMTARETLKGENLSIAPNLNATFFLRSRYEDESATRGKWAVPNEAAILVGGRLAENIGGLVEWGGPLLGAKVSFTKEVAGLRLGTTLFTTDALGAGYGLELANTGAVRNQRPFERSSQPTLSNNSHLVLSQAATGLAFFVVDPQWFSVLTFYHPDSNEAGITDMDGQTNLATYLRGMWLPTFGTWEAGIGAGIYTGKSRATTKLKDQTLGLDEFGNPPGLTDIVTKAWFIDAQLQGQLAKQELGVYFTYGMGEKPSADGKVHLYAGVDKKPKGWGLDAEYFFMGNTLAVTASVGSHDNGTNGLSAKSSKGLGLYWKIAQNITLQPMYELYSGGQGKDLTGKNIKVFTLTLETAF